mmetsp:Transcript_22512/g.48885  ORF Transcript_22512/g.48885 Transcript_22512/m.48885 type:complete len:203 (+) Transcript_22512:492-1100(+)
MIDSIKNQARQLFHLAGCDLIALVVHYSLGIREGCLVLIHDEAAHLEIILLVDVGNHLEESSGDDGQSATWRMDGAIVRSEHRASNLADPVRGIVLEQANPSLQVAPLVSIEVLMLQAGVGVIVCIVGRGYAIFFRFAPSRSRIGSQVPLVPNVFGVVVIVELIVVPDGIVFAPTLGAVRRLQLFWILVNIERRKYCRAILL